MNVLELRQDPFARERWALASPSPIPQTFCKYRESRRGSVKREPASQLDC
jgi:hypothetical protein